MLRHVCAGQRRTGSGTSANGHRKVANRDTNGSQHTAEADGHRHAPHPMADRTPRDLTEPLEYSSWVLQSTVVAA